MERSFFENEPAVAAPKNDVEKTKNLSRDKTRILNTQECHTRRLKCVWKTHHRGVQSAHVRQGACRALVAGILTNVQEAQDGGRASGMLHIGQAPCPSRG